MARSAQAGRRRQANVAGVVISHPDRVLYPQLGVTKLALARYYLEIADWIMPYLRNRPLSVLRCPEGRKGNCFFQKHPGPAIRPEVPRLWIREREGSGEYLYVQDIAHVVALVQAGTLELHPWGCTVDDVERPDTLVLDLDPDPALSWSVMLEAARLLHDRLRAIGLHAFLRTTGGKGLHLVAPLVPGVGWQDLSRFAKALADRLAQEDPGRFTTRMAKTERHGRIFVDHLRNSRGNTAIACYSTRARPGAPVATPIRRDELGPKMTGDRYSMQSVRRRLRALAGDPWEDYPQARRPITDAMLRAVGARAG